VVVDVAERFASQLAGGIGRNGAEDGVVFGKGYLGVNAVNGGGRGDDKLADAVEAGSFEEVDGALDIDALVKGRVPQGSGERPHGRPGE